MNYFRTPDGSIAVALTYGPGADWVRNVLTGGGELEFAGSRHRVANACIGGRRDAWVALPRLVRGALRLLRVRHFLILELDGG